MLYIETGALLIYRCSLWHGCALEDYAYNSPTLVVMRGEPVLIIPNVNGAQAGKVERFIKSEEEPADNNGPVKIVTANTFDDIVFGGKDVLIEFYAPWCGHCKSLAPVYEEVSWKRFLSCLHSCLRYARHKHSVGGPSSNQLVVLVLLVAHCGATTAAVAC